MNLKTLTILFVCFAAQAQAFADPGKLICQNDAFPAGLGSSLELDLAATGLPNHATLELNDSNPQLGGLKTNGSFDALAPTFNEDGTPVIYFRWYGGAGFGVSGDEHLKLVPNKMVIYDFTGNFAHDRTVFLGVIEWKQGQKIETHFVYHCS